jgi:hypothetical protein
LSALKIATSKSDSLQSLASLLKIFENLKNWIKQKKSKAK